MKNNTMNPVRAMMKPMPKCLNDKSRAAVRLAQEQEVCHMLDTAQYSMTVADMVCAYPDFEKFPGYDKKRDQFSLYIPYRRKLISNTCKRLESKGVIISTLMNGRRIYSLPVTDAPKRMVCASEVGVEL